MDNINGILAARQYITELSQKWSMTDEQLNIWRDQFYFIIKIKKTGLFIKSCNGHRWKTANIKL